MSLYSTRCIRGYNLSPDPKIWPDKDRTVVHGNSKVNSGNKEKRYHDQLQARVAWWVKLKQLIGKVLRYPSGAKYLVHEDGSYRKVR